jgi:uncharacterized membrane protein (Fun14 family)
MELGIFHMQIVVLAIFIIILINVDVLAAFSENCERTSFDHSSWYYGILPIYAAMHVKMMSRSVQ